MTDAPTPTAPPTTTTPSDAPANAAPAVTAPVASEASPAPAADTSAEPGTTLLNAALAEQAVTPPAEGETPAPEAEAEVPVVPETYALEAPEGFNLAPESVELATPIFKELGLTNDQANKLVPVAAKFAEQIQARMMDQHTQQVAAWGNEALADAEIAGGNPDTFKQHLGIAAKAINDLAGPEFRTFLDDTGLGNHPAMIRFALRAGKAISDEARIFRSDTSATPAKGDRLTLLYPDDLPKAS